MTFGEDSNLSGFLLPVFGLRLKSLDITYSNFGELVLLEAFQRLVKENPTIRELIISVSN